jgi:hypothetical protein
MDSLMKAALAVSALNNAVACGDGTSAPWSIRPRQPIRTPEIRSHSAPTRPDRIDEQRRRVR